MVNALYYHSFGDCNTCANSTQPFQYSVQFVWITSVCSCTHTVYIILRWHHIV